MYYVNRKWKRLPDEQPDDQMVVFVRTANVMCTPYQAMWNSASGVFTNVAYYDKATATYIDIGLSIYWFSVGSWRLL